MPSWGEILDQLQTLAEPKDPKPHDTLRRGYLEELKEYTGRDVILYSSGWTHLNSGSPDFSMADGDIQGLMEVIYEMGGNELDVILHSPGGTPTAAEGMVDYLRSKYDDIRIIVPHAAMSAATMMCCAADEIVMGKHSSLGPIDPQIGLNTPTGRRSVPAQAILNQFEQAKEEIDNDSDNLAHWTPILRQYGPSLLTECEQAVSLSKELVEDWAESYMFADDPNSAQKAEDLADTLSDWEQFKTHSRPLSMEKAEDIGFDVTPLEDDQRFQELVLSVYHVTTHTHLHNNMAKIIENDEGRAYMTALREEGTQNSAPDAFTERGVAHPPGPPQPDE